MRPEKMCEEDGIETNINHSKGKPYALSEYQRSMYAIFGRCTKIYELDLYLTSSLLIGFCGTCMDKFTKDFLSCNTAVLYNLNETLLQLQ
jgi:hypothetical protein